MKSLYQRKNPEIFQGDYELKPRTYFEGWYFKVSNADGSRVFAIIPGVSLNDTGDKSHSFIQLLDGVNVIYSYFESPISGFSSSRKQFEISIGKNKFSTKEIHLEIEQDNEVLRGDIRISNLVPFPKSILAPNIMGLASYFTFLQCNHGIVSMNYDIDGYLEIYQKKHDKNSDGSDKSAGVEWVGKVDESLIERIDLTGGRGYLEKDFGKSFPSHWLWMQSNHFEVRGVSALFSVGTVPMMKREVPGYFAVVYLPDSVVPNGKHYIFSNPTFGKLLYLDIEEHSVKAFFKKGKNVLQLYAQKNEEMEYHDTALMRAPIDGEMTGKCLESMRSTISIKLFEFSYEFNKEFKKQIKGNKVKDKKDAEFLFSLKDKVGEGIKLIFEGTGKNSGLEIMGTNSDFGY